MKSFTLVGMLFLAVGCAHQSSSRTSTPVALTITSDTASDNFVKRVRDTTLAAITKQVPDARRMTISVKLEVSAPIQSTPSIAWSQPINAQRQIATLSSEPWNEPAPPTVPVNNSVFGTDRSQQITAYRVVYTISDAAGKVVESNQLALDHGRLIDAASHTAVEGREGLVNDTATFLASRVKALNQ